MNSKPHIQVQWFADSNPYSNTVLKIITLKDGGTQRLLSESHDSECSISVKFSSCVEFIEASKSGTKQT